MTSGRYTRGIHVIIKISISLLLTLIFKYMLGKENKTTGGGDGWVVQLFYFYRNCKGGGGVQLYFYRNCNNVAFSGFCFRKRAIMPKDPRNGAKYSYE